MEKEILEELLKDCNLFEKIEIKIMQCIILKSYHKGRTDCFNNLHK